MAKPFSLLVKDDRGCVHDANDDVNHADAINDDDRDDSDSDDYDMVDVSLQPQWE